MRMHLRMRVLSIILLLCVAFSLTPATSEAAILVINPRQAPISLFDRNDLQKLLALRNVTNVEPLSGVSPDDKYIVAGISRRGYNFVNIEDGSITPIAFDRNLIIAPESEIRWRDSKTAVYLASNNNFDSIEVTLSLETGKATAKIVDIPGFPLSLAPNSTTALIVTLAGPSAQSTGKAMQSPFTNEILPAREKIALPEEEAYFKRGGFDAPNDGSIRVAATSLSVAVFDIKSGRGARLYNFPDSSSIYGGAWSGDSSQVALIRYTLLGSGTGPLLSAFLTQEALGQVPPDKNPILQSTFVDTADLKTGTVRQGFVKPSASETDIPNLVAWSPDGQRLLVQMQTPSRPAGRKYPVYIFPNGGYLRFYSQSGELLTTLKRAEIETPYELTPYFISTDEVIINAPYQTDNALFYYNRASGEFRRLPLPSGTAWGSFQVTNQSRQIVFRFSSYTQVPELFRIRIDGTGLTALSFNNTELKSIDQVRADQVSFTLANGEQRTGWLIQPATNSFPPKNVPVVVWQEGGPQASMTNYWYSQQVERPFNTLPNFGIAVLIVPLEGRFGFGPKRFDALVDNDNYGKIDIDEQAEIIRQMITNGWTSRDKVGITGCSYGGYFTSRSITRYPDLYAAANTQCTVLDLFESWQFGQTALQRSYAFGQPPTVNPGLYAEASPLYQSSKVRTPTLIFHGTLDFLPIQAAWNFHDQLQNNGIPVNMYTFLGEGHGLSAANSQISAAQLQITWFRQYLNTGRDLNAQAKN